MIEHGAFGGQPVQIRGVDEICSGAPQIVPTMVVGDDQYNVGRTAIHLAVYYIYDFICCHNMNVGTIRYANTTILYVTIVCSISPNFNKFH